MNQAPGQSSPTRTGRSAWAALVVVSLAQLMIALDATVMNVALPSAQAGLGFSDADRQWVITAYTLVFGGLLLLGGRICDRVGRWRALFTGLAGFAAASAVAGASTGMVMLAVSRAAQGAFAALLAPTVLGLVSVTFTEPRRRAKAFAVFGAIAGGGGAVGLVLGGVLTQWLGWRWCCYVNVPMAAVVMTGARIWVPGERGAHRGRLDAVGAILVTSGVAAVVYGCSQAEPHGWTSAQVVSAVGGGAVALALFGLWESRSTDPLLPPALLVARYRVGACLAVGCAVAALLALFLFLTFYLQTVLGYGPLRAGLAFLPLSLAVLVVAQTIAAPLAHRLDPRLLIVPGLLTSAAAMLLLTRLSPTGHYATGVLPVLILLGSGMGCVFAPAISLASAGVDRRYAGVMAAVVNTCQQAGGSIGVAVFNTISAGTAARMSRGHRPSATAAVHGYATASACAAALLALAALAAALLISKTPKTANAAPTPTQGLKNRNPR